MAEHTPTPWKAHDRGKGWFAVYPAQHGYWNLMGKDDAEFAVRAANSFAPMRDALEEIHAWLVCHPIASADDMAQAFEHMEQIARAALSLAQPEGK